jgi:hypothetical protein
MSIRGRDKVQSRKQSHAPLTGQPKINGYSHGTAVACAQCYVPYGPVGVPQNDRLRSWEKANSRDCFTDSTERTAGYSEAELEVDALVKTIRRCRAEDLREAALYPYPLEEAV